MIEPRRPRALWRSPMRVLVGYASRFGPTRDTAIRIGGTVRTLIADVEVRSVDEIADIDAWAAKIAQEIRVQN